MTCTLSKSSSMMLSDAPSGYITLYSSRVVLTYTSSIRRWQVTIFHSSIKYEHSETHQNFTGSYKIECIEQATWVERMVLRSN